MGRRSSRIAVVVLSLAGAAGLVACGGDVEVVAPEQHQEALATDASTTTTAGGTFDSQAAENTQSDDIAVSDQAPLVETPPPSTTTTTPPTTVPPPVTVPPPTPGQAAASTSLDFVNQKRAENGLAALQFDPELVAMAERWCETIASDGDLRHNPNLGSEAPDEYSRVGENVGYAGSGSAIDNAWWNSEGHRDNILGDYTAIGIAFVIDEDGTYWGVQVFGG